MCSIASQELIMAAASLMILAMGFVTIAIIKNASCVLAPAATGWMIAAGAAAAGASTFVGILLYQVNAYWDCVGNPAECLWYFQVAQRGLEWLLAATIAQSVACFVAAAFAAVPWVAIPAMAVIYGAIAEELDFILNYYDTLKDLVVCVKKAADKPIEPVLGTDPTPALVFLGVTLVSAGVMFYEQRNRDFRKRRLEEDKND